jgi:cell wall-associated NlpC family hydrolase
MSVAEVQSRISEIQSQIALLSPTRTAATAAAFASSLSAQAATGAAGATATRATATSAATITAAAAGTSTTSGSEVVTEAKKYLGIPYVWGGTDPKRGLDCSGLIQLVYKNLGYEVPRVSYQQATAGTAVKGGLANARPGDILAFNSPVSHVGIYIGDNKMIHAPRPGKDVEISDVYDTPVAIRRILPEGGVVSTSAASGLSRVASGTPYANLFAAAGAKHGVDPNLLVAVARQESGFNPKAVSHAGAQGLMQLMPATARGLGVTNSFDPTQAVDGAARLLKSLIQEFGRTDLALAAYNAGPGAVHRYDGIPPYNETQNYVRTIMADLKGR